MTPEQQVAIYTPAYSWVELLLIGLTLAAAFILPTLSAWEIARKERRAAERYAVRTSEDRIYYSGLTSKIEKPDQIEIEGERMDIVDQIQYVDEYGAPTGDGVFIVNRQRDA